MNFQGPRALLGYLSFGGFAYTAYTVSKVAIGKGERVEDEGDEEEVGIDDQLDQLRGEFADKPKRCRPVVMCGPSGAGKSTLIHKLQQEFPKDFGFSVDYHFTKREDIEKQIESGEFIETAEVHGNLYGTSRKSVHDVAEECTICILDIDVQGVKSVQADAADLDARYLFVEPPSMADLEARLRQRGTESEEAIQRRLTNARDEIAEAQTMKFDDRIVNDDLEAAYGQLRGFFKPEIERCRLIRFLKREDELAARTKAPASEDRS